MGDEYTKVIWAILNDKPQADICEGLRLACQHGHIATVKFILTDDILNDVEVCNSLTRECVKIAATFGHFDIVKVLLNNSDLEISNYVKEDLTRWSIMNGYIQILELIPPSPDNIVHSVSLAQQYKKSDIVKFLIQDLTDNQIQKLFLDSCIKDNIQLVKLLIADPRVDPSAKDNVALGSAVYEHKEELVQVLLSDPRVIPTSKMLTRLKNINIVKMLLAHPNVDPSYENYSAIREACQSKLPYLVKIYLDSLNKNKQDDFGICVKGECEILQFKLSCGKFAICYKKILKEEETKFTIVYISDGRMISDGGMHILYPFITTTAMRTEVDEKYLKWQYRIGGDKWLSACKEFSLN